jgi:hypothetical protein
VWLWLGLQEAAATILRCTGPLGLLQGFVGGSWSQACIHSLQVTLRITM